MIRDIHLARAVCTNARASTTPFWTSSLFICKMLCLSHTDPILNHPSPHQVSHTKSALPITEQYQSISHNLTISKEKEKKILIILHQFKKYKIAKPSSDMDYYWSYYHQLYSETKYSTQQYTFKGRFNFSELVMANVLWYQELAILTIMLPILQGQHRIEHVKIDAIFIIHKGAIRYLKTFKLK